MFKQQCTKYHIAHGLSILFINNIYKGNQEANGIKLLYINAKKNSKIFRVSSLFSQ